MKRIVEFSFRKGQAFYGLYAQSSLLPEEGSLREKLSSLRKTGMDVGQSRRKRGP